MSELLKKTNCPNGCINSNIIETIKILKENHNNLLNESFENIDIEKNKIVKICNCSSCGCIFEIYEKNIKNILL